MHRPKGFSDSKNIKLEPATMGVFFADSDPPKKPPLNFGSLYLEDVCCSRNR